MNQRTSLHVPFAHEIVGKGTYRRARAHVLAPILRARTAPPAPYVTPNHGNFMQLHAAVHSKNPGIPRFFASRRFEVTVYFTRTVAALSLVRSGQPVTNRVFREDTEGGTR